jgi:hypothetical protein
MLNATLFNKKNKIILFSQSLAACPRYIPPVGECGIREPLSMYWPLRQLLKRCTP